MDESHKKFHPIIIILLKIRLYTTSYVRQSDVQSLFETDSFGLKCVRVTQGFSDKYFVHFSENLGTISASSVNLTDNIV